ncbi:TPA: RHS repeat-associated core domain-containing protein [Stenotrophomonas maltophilia]|nr:RHS repeat-associated core domain-containing protein [Stenotrophomonas maltophilia]
MAIARSPDVPAWARSRKSEVFGNQIPSADPDGDGVAVELALRFPGQQATDASGLFYNYQREYDPAVGRYSQSDPIGLEGGVNTYAYVGSMPITLNDQHGLQATFADCVSERRWDWGKLGASGPESTSTTGEVASGAQVASAAANSAVGSTCSGISAAPMPRRGSMLQVPRPGRRCSGRQTDADSVQFKRRGVRQEDFWGAWPW